jgi:hypothetical protein
MKNNSILKIIVITIGILLIPLIAMLFTDEVAWSAADFAVAGVLVFGTGLIYEFGVKKIKSRNFRTIVGIALAIGFLLVWAELAVGIFGSPFAGS